MDTDTLEVQPIAIKISRVSPWSRFKVCDDSLNYPGCCVHHDRLSLEERQLTSRSVSSPNFHGLSNNPKIISTSLGDRVSYFSTGNIAPNKFDTKSLKNLHQDQLSGEFGVQHQVFNASTEKSSQISVSEFDELDSKTDFEVKDEEDEDISKSMFSGTGMEFFRKLVHRSENDFPDSKVDSRGYSENSVSSGYTKSETSETKLEKFESESISASSISGSGVVYIGKYLKRNCHQDLRTISSSSSESTLADLIDETFDTEESELKLLNWDDQDDDCLSSDFGSQVFQLDDHMETPCNLIKEVEEEVNTKKAVIPNDYSLKRINVTNEEERQALIQRVKEIEPVRRLLLSSPTFSTTSKGTTNVALFPSTVEYDQKGFQPMPTMSHSRKECVKMFIERTKKAADLARIYPQFTEHQPIFCQGLSPQLKI